jgi:plasmid stabilization system protein ParE
VAKLRVRATAQADLTAIDFFSTEKFGHRVADEYGRGLADAFTQIANHPRSAPARKDYGPRIRCKIYRSHRILYVVDKQGDVEIYRVIHHSRDVRAALEP